MSKIVNTAEKKSLIGYANSKPTFKRGGALSSVYPTKMTSCGCKK
jgi:hypothetical protein